MYYCTLCPWLFLENPRQHQNKIGSGKSKTYSNNNSNSFLSLLWTLESSSRPFVRWWLLSFQCTTLKSKKLQTHECWFLINYDGLVNWKGFGFKTKSTNSWMNSPKIVTQDYLLVSEVSSASDLWFKKYFQKCWVLILIMKSQF